MAKVVCESCGSSFLYDVVKEMEKCPVCGKTLWEDDEDTEKVDGVHAVPNEEEHADWITWYYYGHKSDNGKTASLRDKPIDLSEHGDIFFLIKEFKAPPESECGLDEVKRILRTYIPDAFEESKEVPKVRCPYCQSEEVQIVPKRFSILTGFATNGYQRVCVRCKRKF